MSQTSSPEKILVISTLLLGDCLLSTSIIHNLRKSYPNSKIDVLVSRDGKLVFEHNPDVDEVLYLSKKPKLAEAWQFIRTNFRKYDLVLNESESDRTAIYSLICGKRRVGFNASDKRFNLQTQTYHESINIRGDESHRMQQNHKLLEAIGVSGRGKVIAPSCEEVEIAFVKKQPYLVVHIPASCNFKQWPTKYWVDLCLELLELNYRLVFTGGPGERDRALIDEVTSQLEKFKSAWFDLSGKVTLAQTGAVISEAIGFIGPDTGPAHLASAFPVPQVVLFGPTPPNMWAPWPYEHEIGAVEQFAKHRVIQTIGNITTIQSSQDCVPCYAKECAITQSDKPDCLHNIKPEQVLATVIDRMPLDEYQ